MHRPVRMTFLVALSLVAAAWLTGWLAGCDNSYGTPQPKSVVGTANDNPFGPSVDQVAGVYELDLEDLGQKFLLLASEQRGVSDAALLEADRRMEQAIRQSSIVLTLNADMTATMSSKGPNGSEEELGTWKIRGDRILMALAPQGVPPASSVGTWKNGRITIKEALLPGREMEVILRRKDGA